MKKKNTYKFNKIFNDKYNFNSILELGSNMGQNLVALKKKYKKSKIYGVDINATACEILKRNYPDFNITNSSILNYKTKKKFDLVFTSGVLIHINPKQLNNTYKKIFNLSKKYILIVEYYNSSPVSVIYRGHYNKLFKRDFAGDLMERYNLKLIDYGFFYHKDRYSFDDITWFLLKK